MDLSLKSQEGIVGYCQPSRKAGNRLYQTHSVKKKDASPRRGSGRVEDEPNERQVTPQPHPPPPSLRSAKNKRRERKELSHQRTPGWLCDQLIKLNGEPGGPSGGRPERVAFGAMGKGAASVKCPAGHGSNALRCRGPKGSSPRFSNPFEGLTVAPLKHYLRFSLCWALGLPDKVCLL